jgi:uncharacterized oxidoreductase
MATLSRETTEWGIARAKDSGVAILSLRDAYHIARVGTYGELVSVMFVNVVAGGLQKVAPFGGADARAAHQSDLRRRPGRSGSSPVRS